MSSAKEKSRLMADEKDVKLIPYDPLTSTLSSECSSGFLSFYQPYKSSKGCYAIDVECVATGVSHDARAVAHVAIVDQWCRLVLNVYVKPKEKVVSYLTDLTGLTKDNVDGGISLEECVEMVKNILSPTDILVGQNILKDVTWLTLIEGRDFGSVIDLSGLWRVFNPNFKNYSYFSLYHKAKCLLDYDHTGPHDPLIDSLLSMQLYNLYCQLQHYPSELRYAYQLLLQTPVEKSFSQKNGGIYDGVCMGLRKTCKCGDPFLY